MGTLRADQFHSDRATQHSHLDGHVHMTLIGNEEMKRALLILLLAAIAALPPPAFGAAPRRQAASLAKHDTNAPINISADKFPGRSQRQDRHLYRQCRGDPGRHAACAPIRCASTTVNGKADKIFASGNVVVDSPTSGTVTGDNGVYDVVAAHRDR